MASFDLTREPWIPVERTDGTSKQVSLRTALTEAHLIGEVYADTPLQTMALYRLLQALAIRIEGAVPSGRKEWVRRYEEKDCFQTDQIHSYFDRWQDRRECFDLFHPERPFYQHPEPLTKQVKSVADLFAGRASGINATLFDHSLDEEPDPASPSEAARGLVATQAAALAGGRSRPFYYKDAPLASGSVFWIRGENLFEALLLNTPPTLEARMSPGSQLSWERAWELGELPEPEVRPEEGYLDYLTWPSRRILLETNTDSGEAVVDRIKISQGDAREDGDRDPLMAYNYSSRSGIYPLRIRKDRALWRDANVLMQVFSEETGGAPRTVQWVSAHVPEARWWVDVFGMATDQSKIEKWRHLRMPVYPAILKSDVHQHALQEALGHAERQAGTLQKAAREYAAYLQYNCGYDDLDLNNQRQDAREVARSSGALRQYWSRLEDPFYGWLEDLSGAAERAERDVGVLQARWTKTAYVTANRAYEEALGTLGETAKHMRAQVAGKERLRPAAAFADVLKEQPA